MPETVCVAVEQLRKWASPFREVDDRELSPEDRYKLEQIEDGISNAIAQAERLKDWQPKVGDRVRLRSRPEVIGEVLFEDGCIDGLWFIGFDDGDEGSRYVAELMPEEGE